MLSFILSGTTHSSVRGVHPNGTSNITIGGNVVVLSGGCLPPVGYEKTISCGYVAEKNHSLAPV